MHVQFHDNLDGGPRSREEVRFNRLGLYVYEDGRRVAIGFDLTPFIERPSILVQVWNADGEEAASLSVIEAMQPNFNLTLHLRDEARKDPYEVEAILYYVGEQADRLISDRHTRSFKASIPGDQ